MLYLLLLEVLLGSAQLLLQLPDAVLGLVQFLLQVSLLFIQLRSFLLQAVQLKESRVAVVRYIVWLGASDSARCV